MGFYLDIGLIAILLTIVIINFSRGILKALKRFKKWAALAIAWMLKAPFAELLSNFINLDGFKSSIYERAYSMWGSEINQVATSGEAGAAEAYDGIFGFLGNILSGISDLCVQAVNSGIDDVAHTVSVFISENLTNFVFQAIAFVGCFIVVYLLLSLVLSIVNSICKKTILGGVNHLLGGALGIISGLLIVWGISLIAFLILPDVAGTSSFALWLKQSFFLSRFFGIA